MSPELRWTRTAGRSADAPHAPPVLAVHGFAATVTQCWLATGWLKRLGTHRDLVFVELPWHPDAELTGELESRGARVVGSGTIPLADDSDAPLTADDVVDALADAARDALATAGAERGAGAAVDVVGYSLGARLAWGLGAAEPSLIRRMAFGGLPASDELAAVADRLRAEEDPKRSAEPADREPPRTEGAVSDVMGFVGCSALDRGDLRRCAERLSSPPFQPFRIAAPAQPSILVSGEDDAVAKDSASLLGLLGSSSKHVSLPGRDHVNALTSGRFARMVLEHFSAPDR